MTPFGKALRELRLRKGVKQAEMAAAIGVSAAYLSALEHGHRGKPSFDFLQRVAGYFNIIWDEAEELFMLAEASDPRVIVDTSDMPPEYTAFANRLAKEIRSLSPDMLQQLMNVLESGRPSG
ncbi:helix-turn-helix domain-containing protein [Rhizobium panacihumi]|uniref:helix-turn-helix domain-containing protein n=1 Tax=Rhizobium panacihumi TaxID=2008450 RepID=UPI003D79B1F0